MGRREHLIKELKKFIERIKKEFKIEIIIFFGSRAIGKQLRDSDIDLIIISKDFRRMNFIERATKMYDFWELDYPVDFLCYTPEEFNKLKNRITIVREAVEGGIEIN